MQNYTLHCDSSVPYFAAGRYFNVNVIEEYEVSGCYTARLDSKFSSDIT